MLKQWKIWIPSLIFMALIILFAIRIGQPKTDLPSPLIGKTMPIHRLPEVADASRLYDKDDLVGRVALLNVWASWCLACRLEHPVLTQIAESHTVALYGLNYKDKRPAALKWLSQQGNPYYLNLYDEQGSMGLDLGVYGVPETYVIDQNGVIRDKVVGELTEALWQERILPLVQKLQAGKGEHA